MWPGRQMAGWRQADVAARLCSRADEAAAPRCRLCTRSKADGPLPGPGVTPAAMAARVRGQCPSFTERGAPLLCLLCIWCCFGQIWQPLARDAGLPKDTRRWARLTPGPDWVIVQRRHSLLAAWHAHCLGAWWNAGCLPGHSLYHGRSCQVRRPARTTRGSEPCRPMKQ